MTIDFETLMAYADDELEPPRRDEVARALAEDPGLAAQLEALRSQQEDLRRAFEGDLREPLPPSVTALVEAMPAAGGRAAPRAMPWWKAAMAAGIASVLLGGASALAVSEWRSESLIARYEAQRQEDQAALAALVQRALEVQRSGMPLFEEAGGGDSAAKVEPLRTFQNASGAWCREYRTEAVIGRQREAQRAIACRTETGAWVTRVQADVEPSVGSAI